MNPHRYSWGYAHQIRMAAIIAVATVIGWLFSREPKRPPAEHFFHLATVFGLTS